MAIALAQKTCIKKEKISSSLAMLRVGRFYQMAGGSTTFRSRISVSVKRDHVQLHDCWGCGLSNYVFSRPSTVLEQAATFLRCQIIYLY